MKFFTKVFRDALAANATALTGKTLRLVLFRNAPRGSTIEFDYGVAPTVKKLLDGNYPGWETIDHPAEYTSRLPVNLTTTAKGTVQVDFSSFVLSGLTKKVEVMAMGVEVVGTFWGETDPLLFITDEPFPDGRIVMDKNNDAIMAVASKTPGVNNNWLVGWTNTTDGQARQSSLTVGGLATYLGPPDYHSAHHFDAWMYPQRVNYICNPSFEAINNKYWASNGTFTRVRSDAGGFAGKFTGGNLVVESNTFPIDNHQGIWTIQMMIKGTGRLSVGFVHWAPEYTTTSADWGDELWELSANGFISVKVTRQCPEATEGMLRLQVEDGEGITIDRVLCEPGPLLDWPYFDGDEQYGALNDFSWYGVRGESYSFWYNNRRSIISRLYQGGDVEADRDLHGLAYNWVPAGTEIVQHLDVLRPNDLKTPPPVKTGVMPDNIVDPIFGVQGGTANVLTATGITLYTVQGENVLVANA